jgi:hypothetical protein
MEASVELNECPVNCVRWQVARKCVHIYNKEVQQERLKLSAMREKKRAEYEAARAKRVQWEVSRIEWQRTDDWQELPHREGVYLWITNKPLVVGSFTDLKRGHYGLCRSGEMEHVENGVLWWLETALTREIVDFLKVYIWGGVDAYKKEFAKRVFDDETRELTLRVHPLYSLWGPRTEGSPEQVVPASRFYELEFWL